MIYLQTSCWSLAQRSRLMTPEHGSKIRLKQRILNHPYTDAHYSESKASSLPFWTSSAATSSSEETSCSEHALASASSPESSCSESEGNIEVKPGSARPQITFGASRLFGRVINKIRTFRYPHRISYLIDCPKIFTILVLIIVYLGV